MKTLFRYLIIACVLASAACSREDVTEYENSPKLNFLHGKYAVQGQSSTQRDSLNHLFFQVPAGIERDTVHVEVVTMGFAASYDRPFAVRQANSSDADAAIAGTHYLGFDNFRDGMIIPAGSTLGSIPVVLLRDGSLEDMSVRLVMEIVPNEHFEAGIEELRKFVVITSDMVLEPELWQSRWGLWFGTWGPVKMTFLRDYVVGPSFDWNTNISDDTQLDQLRITARIKLAEYNEAQGPDDANWLRENDENRTLVSF